MNEEALIERMRMEIRAQIFQHEHNGQESQQIKDFDIFGELQGKLNTEAQTIATTGNTDWYMIAPISGNLETAFFSGTDALATNDTNYITFSITNLGRDGSGSTALLSAADDNTTKATGGSALTADTVRELLISGTYNASLVVAGDRLRIRAAVTNTLANTVTNSVLTLIFK